MKKIIYPIIFIATVLLSCNKKDFLDAKPDKSLVIPQSLADFQAIMDNDLEMNGTTTEYGPVPGMGEMSADNYFVLDADYNTIFQPQQKNVYVWAKNIYDGSAVNDWDMPYKSVFNCNFVLEGINSIPVTEQNKASYNRVLGSALFFRAHAFYQLAQVFAPPYQKTNAASQLGIPLRLSTDISEKISRATLKDTYDRVITDLLKSKDLLPTDNTAKTRPSRQAAYGLLARVYQTMQEYDKALLYADSCLQLHSYLLDYQSINASATYPFNIANDEMIFSCKMTEVYNGPLYATRAKVDNALYQSYDANDIRKTIFFRTATGGYRFKGSYLLNYLFAGLATDEIFLIRAESYARAGKTLEAMNDLNTLLIKRWAKNKFMPYTAADAGTALNLILQERRKELIFRGLRWPDLRRLNLEGRNISLTRIVNGTIYSLPSGDPRWTLPIPLQVIGFNPGMPQNDR
ncbi:RagB/SusD family nutrient uptake outer membrane protein [Mucilaginibacter paludis]|uniref:RagB/SusD domain-containing protein n=1 Tax=Mucilaginibacter paludis DSM 18603 TaxID=714943 RepID=H1YIK5_9SPHI|nr:RagB/SusD family nutrient uptake outer membrane protein [Mucilaginibacter paludis]EHQ26571.1 hypothetical protein Mucpa_2449 [Mucilaginibacter paludis DSM 18603]